MERDEKTERMPTAAEALGIQARTDAAKASPAQRPRIGAAWFGAMRLPTPEQLADNEVYAAMLDVMRRAGEMRLAGWSRPCCPVCGKQAQAATVVDGVLYRPDCHSCALDRALKS